MIRINLLGEEVDHSFRYMLEGVGFFSALAVALFVCIVWHSEMESKVDSLKGEEVRLRTQLARLEKVTKEIDGLESKKKTLREKLQTISLLKAKKHGPVHILDDVNMALPDRAWLTSMKEKGGILEISGVALDNQTLAVFMNTLARAKYFGNVELLISTEYVQDDVKLQQFSLAVTLLDPLKKKALSSEQTITFTFDADGNPVEVENPPNALVSAAAQEPVGAEPPVSAVTEQSSSEASAAPSDGADTEEGQEEGTEESPAESDDEGSDVEGEASEQRTEETSKGTK